MKGQHILSLFCNIAFFYFLSLFLTFNPRLSSDESVYSYANRTSTTNESYY